MWVPSSRQGNARSAETVTPPGSTPMVIASAGTPGSAICMRISSPASITSTGGSHALTACVKNCRCRRSARSSIDRASCHIQAEKSRDLTGPMWRRRAAESRLAKNAPLSAGYTCNTGLPLLEGNLAPGRGDEVVLVPEIDASARDVVGRDLQAHAVAGEDADAVLPHPAAGVGEHGG